MTRRQQIRLIVAIERQEWRRGALRAIRWGQELRIYAPGHELPNLLESSNDSGGTTYLLNSTTALTGTPREIAEGIALVLAAELDPADARNLVSR